MEQNSTRAVNIYEKYMEWNGFTYIENFEFIPTLDLITLITQTMRNLYNKTGLLEGVENASLCYLRHWTRNPWMRLRWSLSDSLHLSLAVERLHEERRRVLCVPLMFFGVLTEWEDDGVNRHLHHGEEQGCNNVTKSPAHLTKYYHWNIPMSLSCIVVS